MHYTPLGDTRAIVLVLLKAKRVRQSERLEVVMRLCYYIVRAVDLASEAVAYLLFRELKNPEDMPNRKLELALSLHFFEPLKCGVVLRVYFSGVLHLKC